MTTDTASTYILLIIIRTISGVISHSLGILSAGTVGTVGITLLTGGGIILITATITVTATTTITVTTTT